MTYDDVLASGVPLSVFAKVCKISESAVRNWSQRQIPKKYQRLVFGIIENARKAAARRFQKIEDKKAFDAVQSDVFSICVQDVDNFHKNSIKNINLTHDLGQNSTPYLANIRKTAASRVSRGLQPVGLFPENHPPLTDLQAVLSKDIDKNEQNYYGNLDALTFALNADADVKSPFLEYYFLSSVVRRIELKTKIDNFKKIRSQGGVAAPLKHSLGAFNCGRRVMSSELRQKIYGDDKPVGAVDIIRCNQSLSYHGLMVCKDIWGCPTCARKITERRKNGLSLLLNAHVEKYGTGSIVSCLFTFPHGLGDDLDDILTRMHKAWRFMTMGHGFRYLLISSVGVVRALESTYGKAGFHPHFHVLYFFDHDMTAPNAFSHGGDVRFLHDELFKLWGKALRRFDFAAPDLRAFGCDSIPTDSASLKAVADYFGKIEKDVKEQDINVFLQKHRDFRSAEGVTSSRWSTEHEMTKWHIKSGGKFAYSMFDFLRGFVICDLTADISGRETFRQLWLTYRFGFRGRRQLFVKHDDFKIAELELSDSEVSDMDAKDDKELLASIDFDDWVTVLRCNARAALLRVADKTNGAGVTDFIDTLRDLIPCLPVYQKVPFNQIKKPPIK